MSAGTTIAAEIAQGLAQAAHDTGQGELQALIIRPGAADTSTTPPTIGASTDFDFTALQTQFTNAERQSGAVQVRDVKFILEAGEVEPRNDDKIKVGGIRYEIVGVEVVAPGGVPLAACRMTLHDLLGI